MSLFLTNQMEMLHCIKQVQSEGGENQVADGFYAAKVLKEKYPEHYKTLTTVPVDFSDIGEDAYKFHNQYKQYTIT